MKPLINGTNYALPGYPRAKIDGRMTYVANGVEERTPWLVPDGQTNPAWRVEWDRDRLAEYAEAQTTKMLVVNIEHWPTEQLGRLVAMFEVLRAANNSLKLGVWSVLPQSNYYILANYAAYTDFKAGRPHNEQTAEWWALPQNWPTIKAAYDGWRTENALRAKILRPHIDFTCPSIYPVVEPPADKPWMGAREPELMIAEAKRLCPALPCYPCWQPHLPGGTVLASATYARTVLMTAMAKADGVMIWADNHVTQAQAMGVMETASIASAAEMAAAVNTYNAQAQAWIDTGVGEMPEWN